MRPVLLGFTVAVLLIVLINYASRALQSPRHARWTSCVVFALWAAGFGAGVFAEDRPLLRLGYAATSGFLIYAVCATALGWPGFRPPPPQDEVDDGDTGDV